MVTWFLLTLKPIMLITGKPNPLHCPGHLTMLAEVTQMFIMRFYPVCEETPWERGGWLLGFSVQPGLEMQHNQGARGDVSQSCRAEEELIFLVSDLFLEH